MVGDMEQLSQLEGKPFHFEKSEKHSDERTILNLKECLPKKTVKGRENFCKNLATKSAKLRKVSVETDPEALKNAKLDDRLACNIEGRKDF